MQVVLNITNTFDSSFSRWTVGLGIEHQLNELRVAADLAEEARFRARARNLDYAELVHPEVAICQHLLCLSVTQAVHQTAGQNASKQSFVLSCAISMSCWALPVCNSVD